MSVHPPLLLRLNVYPPITFFVHHTHHSYLGQHGHQAAIHTRLQPSSDSTVSVHRHKLHRQKSSHPAHHLLIPTKHVAILRTRCRQRQRFIKQFLPSCKRHILAGPQDHRHLRRLHLPHCQLLHSSSSVPAQ